MATEDKPRGRGLARVMAVLALIGAALVPVAVTVGWSFLSFGVVRSLQDEPAQAPWAFAMFTHVAGWNVGADDIASLTTQALIAGWLIALVASTPAVVALLCVRGTLAECAAGRTFSARSVASFRRFAWASLIAAIIMPVTRTATGVAMTVLSPDIQNELTVGIGSLEISRTFAGLLLVSVAHMFAEAQRMSEDVEGLL